MKRSQTTSRTFSGRAIYLTIAIGTLMKAFCRLRGWIAASMVAVLVLACTPKGAPAAAAPPSQPSSTQDQADDAFKPSQVGQYLMDGASFELRQNSRYSYTIVATLPTGNVAQTTYAVDPQPVPLVSLAPSAVAGARLRAFHYAHSLSPSGSLSWSYDYVLPADAFPPNAFTAAKVGEAPGSPENVLRLLLEPATAFASEGDGVSVIVTGELTEITKETISHLEEHELQLEGSPLTKAADWGKALYEGLEAREEWEKMIELLEELRACAENPTNPLTQKANEANPQEKERLLDEIDAARSDIAQMTAARFLGLLNDRAASLIKAAPWLGFVVGPGTAWANQTLSQVMKERVSQLQREVPKCEKVHTWTGTITRTETTVSGDSNGDETSLDRHFDTTVKLKAVPPDTESMNGTIEEQYNFRSSTVRHFQDQVCRQTLSRESTSWDVATGSAADTARITLSVAGSHFSISAVASSGMHLIAKGYTFIQQDHVRAVGSGCNVVVEKIPPTPSNYETDFVVPALGFEGEIDPKDPHHIKGSTTTKDGKTTTTITWDLQESQ